MHIGIKKRAPGMTGQLFPANSATVVDCKPNDQAVMNGPRIGVKVTSQWPVRARVNVALCMTRKKQKLGHESKYARRKTSALKKARG